MFTTKSIIRGGDVIRDEWSLTFDGTDDNIDCGDIGSPNDYQTYIGWLKNLQESGDGKKIALIFHYYPGSTSQTNTCVPELYKITSKYLINNLT